jgi:hypothetical protein
LCLLVFLPQYLQDRRRAQNKRCCRAKQPHRWLPVSFVGFCGPPIVGRAGKPQVRAFHLLLLWPGGRNRKMRNQIGTVTSAPNSKFDEAAQAKPFRA